MTRKENVAWTLFEVLIFTLSIGLLVVAVFNGLAEDANESFVRGISIVLFVCLLIGLNVVARKRFVNVNPVTQTDFSPTEIADPVYKRTLTEIVRRGYSELELDLLSDMMIHPNNYIVRVIEDVAIEHHTLRLTTELNLSFPALKGNHDNDCVLVPAMWTRKGVLLDNLNFEGGGGKHAAALSTHEAKCFTVLIARQLHWRAFGGAKPTTEFLRRFSYIRPWTVEEITAAQQELDERESVLTAHQSAQRDALRDLRELCNLCAQHYLHIVELQKSCRPLLRYQRTVPLSTAASMARRGGKVKRRLRLLLGLRPDHFDLGTAWPLLTPSYHFRLNSEPGQYVRDHYLGKPDGQRVSLMDFPDHPRPDIRVHYPSGKPYAHLFVRDMDTAANPILEPRVGIGFSEVPPGVLGTATFVSFMITALLGTFTFVKPAASNMQALPGILLALVGFASTWLGFTSDKDSLLRTSLTARLGLLVIALLSFLSALLYVAGYNWNDTGTQCCKALGSLLWSWLEPETISWVWLALTLVGLVSFFWLLKSFLESLWFYVEATKR